MDGDIRFVLLGLAVLSARIGLCLYLCGMSRSKNAAAAVTRVLADLCVAILAFWAVGNAIFIGRLGYALGRHDSFESHAFLLATIVAVATGAALGGTLERMKLLPSLVMSGTLAGIVVPLGMHWAWRGWLYRMGFLDTGGGCFLHLTGGLCAAAGAMAVGAREGKYNHDGSANRIPGHNIPLAAAGVLAMLIGLLAQIVGCAALRQSPLVAIGAGEGLLAAAAGGLAGLALGRARYATTDFHLTCVGLLGGVVSIAAGVGHFSAYVAVLTGAIGGFLAAWASVWIDLKRRIDDPASSAAIHGVGGAWGVTVGALLYFPPFPLVQALGIAVIGGIALGLCAAIYLAFGLTGGLRASAADELDGADLVEHDLNAYPDFQQTTIKSHHLRQM